MAETSKSKRYTIEDLKQLMAHLRTPELGCPWDLKQDFQSIVEMTVEETYEVVDAIENQNYSQLKEELGDLLFHVIFYSHLGAEQSLFDFDGVVDSVTKKLVSRHPHVFPSGELKLRQRGEALADEEIKQRWDDIKKKEREQKGLKGLMDDIPKALPAFLRAEKLQKRAAKIGFDWDAPEPVLSKLDEEVNELKEAMEREDSRAIEEEFGDVLFTMVNLSRHLKISAEGALRKANSKFEQRFQQMEKEASDRGQDLNTLTAEELEALWQKAKQD